MRLDLEWEEAVLQVLRNHRPDAVSLQVVYFEVDKYKKIREWHLETTKYGEPRYKHIVRATVNNLNRKGLVERIRRGMYILKE